MNEMIANTPKSSKNGNTPTRSKHLSARKIGLKKTIVIVGLMGAGKTTVGRRLARKLNLPFVDSDHEVEKAASLSVAEIFEMFGEEEFRSGERRVIERLLKGKVKVLATGGGAFMNESTRALIKENAITVWIKVDVPLLVERTKLRDTRPLLKKGNRLEILTRLAEERYPIYGEADITTLSVEGSHDEVVDDILDLLKKYLRENHE